MEFALPAWNRQPLIDGRPTPFVPGSVFPIDPTVNHSGRSALIVIDSALPDYQQLIAGIQPGANVLVLDPAQDAIAQITRALLKESGVSSLQILSHGTAGAIQLGATWIDRSSLDRYQTEFKLWSAALNPDADILLYGCDVAQGEAGQAFLNRFADLTHADLAASDNLTGNAQLQGDWTLEANTGVIESAIAIRSEALSAYQHVLPVDLISVSNSVLTNGSAGIDSIGRNAVSGDGRYVVFTSSASTIAGNDTNGATDVFLYDRDRKTTTLISQNAAKTGSAAGASFNPVISNDGNSIAFISDANDLVASMSGNTNKANNIFVWNRSTQQITLVSQDADGKSGIRNSATPSISDDGAYIAFETQAQLLRSDSSSRPDVYVWSRDDSKLMHLSRNRTGASSGSQGATAPMISGDGNFVVFSSLYTNLAPGDTNRVEDVFLWQRSTDTVVNLSENGTAASKNPTISRDGGRVAFVSAGNFDIDTNGVNNVYVWTRSPNDPLVGTLQLASINQAGTGSGNAGSTGVSSDSGSRDPVLSHDGRYVAFTSASSDLVGDDNNDKTDVFTRDLDANQTVLVSRNSANQLGNGDSGNVSVSTDGTRIAFTSVATNLVNDDTNQQQDIFVRDISTGKPDSGKTFLISRTATGSVGNNISSSGSGTVSGGITIPIISSDGSQVAFISQANNLTIDDNNGAIDGFLIGVTTGNATLISQSNTDPNLASLTGSGDSVVIPGAVSENGQFVVFSSAASEVVSNDTNNVFDVFLRDRSAKTTTLISRSINSTSGNAASISSSISADGNYIVFTSSASDLVGQDANSTQDVFWYDRRQNQMRLVSQAIGGTNSGNGTSTNAVMSADGQYVTFVSTASNLVSNDTNNKQDVFVWDSKTGTIANLTAGGDGDSNQVVISSDGRYVAFVSDATNLVSGDTNDKKDVFVWDRTTGKLSIASQSTSGAIGDDDSSQPSLSDNGKIAFTSLARNLAATLETDRDRDVFVRDLTKNETVLVSANQSGGYSTSAQFSTVDAFNPRISSNGEFVAFVSGFSDLVATDTNSANDVFVRNLSTSTTELISVSQAGNDSGNGVIGTDAGTVGGFATGSLDPTISSNGRFVAFSSFSSNLVTGDTNNALDVFVRDRTLNKTTLVSRTPSDVNSGKGASFYPIMNRSGNYIAFTSDATDLTPRDLNSKFDVFGLNLLPTLSLLASKDPTAEGASTGVQFTVRRSDTAGAVTVKLAIDASSTASSDDYKLNADPSLNLAQNGSEITLQLADGVAEGVFTLTAIDDVDVEGDETLSLSLVNTADYGIADSFSSATTKIIDNDEPVIVSIVNITPTTTTEGNTGDISYTFEVRLSSEATTPVTVNYATVDETATVSDNDYAQINATSLTFGIGEKVKIITVNGRGDTKFELDETFAVQLSSPSRNAKLDASSNRAIATILNDDPAPKIPNMTIAGDDTIQEGDAGTKTYTLTVTLDAPSSDDITVDYTIRDLEAKNGEDYTASAGKLTFAAGTTSRQITVDVNGDRTFEPNERFQIELSNPIGVLLADDQKLKTVTIQNDDAEPVIPNITIAGDNTIQEGDTGTKTYLLTATLSEPTSSDVTVDYVVRDREAKNGQDYTASSGKLTFVAGTTSQQISVAINGDRTFELDEQFEIELSNPTGASIADDQKLKTVTIQNDDAKPTLKIEAPSSQAESTSPYNFTVTLIGETAIPVTVEYAAIDNTAKAGEDYTLTAGTLTFDAGETSKTISANLISDNKREGDETFSVKLTNATNATLQTDTAIATIVDDSSIPTLILKDASVKEGNSGDTTLTFEVGLTNASDTPITINYATQDGTATESDNDYEKIPSGTLTFAPGTTTQTIAVKVKGDTKRESNETFKLSFSSPNNNVTIPANAVATGTIENDDTIPGLSVADAQIDEGGILSFVVTLSDASTDPISVEYKTSDGSATTIDNDYTDSGTQILTFAPNETTKTIRVQTTADTKLEGDETLTLTLNNPTNATLNNTTAIGTIKNDDQRPTIGISTTPRSEGNSGKFDYPFVITLSNASTQPITVKYQTVAENATAGEDYDFSEGTVTFNPGELEKTVIVQTIGDRTFEPTETFIVRLSDPTNADLSTSAREVQGTLLNDDALPTVSIAPVSQAEGNSGNTPFQFVVSLTNPSSKAITVDYTTVPGAAIAGEDYTPATGTLTFAPGQIQQTITVPVKGDTAVEPDEDFTVQLSNPSNAAISSLAGAAKGMIQNDDQPPRPTISIDDVVTSEGNSGETLYTFKVKLSQPTSNPISVQYRTIDGDVSGSSATIADNDYTSATGTLSFAPNQTEQQFTVRVKGDTTFEPDEFFLAELFSPTNADISQSKARGIISNDDAKPTISVSTVAQPEGNVDGATTDFVFNVTLSNPSAQVVTVNYTTQDGNAQTSDNDYDATSGQIRFAPGVTSQTIAVKVKGDRKYEPNESFSIQLSSPTNADLSTSQGIGTILPDDDRPTISILDPAPILEGNSGTSAIAFTVRLSNPSAETVSVQYVTKNGDANETDFTPVTAPLTLTFAPGQTQQTILIPIIGDTQYESDETFSVELRNPSNGTIATNSAIATIRNDDSLPSLKVVAVGASKPEGNSGITPFTFEVSLSAASSLPVTVSYTTADGTATIGDNDYVKAADSITFAPGETKKTITVNVLGDTRYEGSETFDLTLSTPTNATIDTATVTATISEDDPAPTSSIDNSPDDIFWRNGRSGETMLWLPAGTLVDRELPILTIEDSRWRIVATGDFDGNGTTDLLWRNSTTGENGIWRMAPDLSFQSNYIQSVPGSNWEIKGVGDFNRDRKIDIFWRNAQTGENAVWFMKDSTVESAAYIRSVPDPSWNVEQIADFNNDGNADLFWRNSRTGETGLWLMDGAQVKSSHYLLQVSDLAWQPKAVGDFDRDGFVDLLWRNSRTGENAFWLLRDGQRDRDVYIPGVGDVSWQIDRVADFNGDQNLDILWRNSSTQETGLWLMNRTETGTRIYLPNLPNRNWTIAGVGQFSGDKPEIMLRNYQTGENRVWRINPNPFSQTVTLDRQPDSDWQVQATADFDRNGEADILWRNLRTREVSVWLTQNQQVTQKIAIPQGLNAGLDWTIQGVADFSGDGTPDILWRNERNGEMWLWQIDRGQYSSATQIAASSATDWTIQGIADFNGDRSPDLIWRSSKTGELGFWLFDRTRITHAFGTTTVSDLNWQIKAFDDFNGDGKLDLVWRNDRTGETGLWMMNGTQFDRAILLPSPSINWEIVGTGDFNRDGQVDLLWRDRIGGLNAVWSLISGQLALGSYIPTLSDLGWQVEGIDDF